MAAVKGPKNRRSSAAEQRRSSEERRNYINYNTTPDSRRHGQDNSAVLALAWATLRSTCGGCIFVRGMSLQRLQLRRRQRRRLLLTSHLGPSRTVAVHPLVRARTARTARRRRTTQSHATDKRAARRPGRSHRLTNSPLLSYPGFPQPILPIPPLFTINTANISRKSTSPQYCHLPTPHPPPPSSRKMHYPVVFCGSKGGGRIDPKQG